MKKLFAIILVLVLTLCLLTACGQKTQTDETTQTVEATENVQVKELKIDSQAENNNDYKFKLNVADILTDEARADGWGYYYTDTTEDNAPIIDLEIPKDVHTAAEFGIAITNLATDQSQAFVDRAQAVVVFNPKDEVDTNKVFDKDYQDSLKTNGAEVYDVTKLQVNPGQIDADGYLNIQSTKGVTLSKDEETNMMFRFFVSDAFYNSWLDKSSPETMYAYLTFGTDIYKIELKNQLQDFGEIDEEDQVEFN